MKTDPMENRENKGLGYAAAAAGVGLLIAITPRCMMGYDLQTATPVEWILFCAGFALFVIGFAAFVWIAGDIIRDESAQRER